MSGRGTLILLVVAVALGAYYYLWEVRGGSARKAAEEEALRVFRLTAGEVQEIETVQGADTLLLVRGEEGWRIERPLEASADQSAVESALSAVLGGKREAVVDTAAADLSPFGLVPSPLEITLRDGEGGAVEKLLVGDLNPTRSFAYARFPDSSQVLLIGSAVKTSFDKTADDFRDRKVMEVEPADVSRMVVQAAGKDEMVIEREGERGWRLTAPFSARADRVMVEQVLRQLGSARVERFVAEAPENLAPYGLDHPEFTLRVEFGGDAASKGLEVGELSEDEEGYYAKREGRPNVFLLPDDSLIRFLGRGAEEYRAKNLIDFEYTDVARVALAAGDTTYVLVRGEKDTGDGVAHSIWTVEGTGEEIPSDKMSGLLWELRRLRYASVVEEVVDDPARYGLAPPRLKVTLWNEVGEELGELLLGGEREGENEFYAMNGAESILYSITQRSVERLPRSLEELRESTEPAS